MNLIHTITLCLALFGAAAYAEVEAHKSVVAYSGSTYHAEVWSEPYIQTFGSQTSCNAGQTQPYVSFTATFSTSGVQEIIANTKSSYYGTLKVFIYTGATVNFARPCVGLFVGTLGSGFGRASGPTIDDFVYFPAGTYTFIVSGDGSFAINIISPAATGQLTSSSPHWNVPTFDYSLRCAVSNESSTSAAFSTYTWKQGSSGLFDVTTFFNNPSMQNTWWYPGVVLYAGSYSIESLQQNPCNNKVVDYASGSYFGAAILNVNLTAGEVYTAAFSSRYAGYYAYWGLDIVPTRVRFFHQKGFDQPYLSGSTCESGYQTNTGWSATPFYASTNGIYLLSLASAPAPYAPSSLYMFLYEGITWDGSYLPPPTCPDDGTLVYSSYSSLTAVFDARESTEYTLVVALGGQATPAQAYQLFAITGPVIGHRPPVSSASASYASISVSSNTFGTTADACRYFISTFVVVLAALSLLI